MMQRMLAKQRKRDPDEGRSQVEDWIENERMLVNSDESGFVAKWGMTSNELRQDCYDFLS